MLSLILGVVLTVLSSVEHVGCAVIGLEHGNENCNSNRIFLEQVTTSQALQTESPPLPETLPGPIMCCSDHGPEACWSARDMPCSNTAMSPVCNWCTGGMTCGSCSDCNGYDTGFNEGYGVGFAAGSASCDGRITAAYNEGFDAGFANASAACNESIKDAFEAGFTACLNQVNDTAKPPVGGFCHLHCQCCCRLSGDSCSQCQCGTENCTPAWPTKSFDRLFLDDPASPFRECRYYQKCECNLVEGACHSDCAEMRDPAFL